MTNFVFAGPSPHAGEGGGGGMGMEVRFTQKKPIIYKTNKLEHALK